MKILTNAAALTALMLGCTLAQAATTTSSIPMGVTVPRTCVLSGISSGIVLPEDGSEVQGAVTLTCNIHDSFSITYSLDSVAHSQTAQVSNSHGVALPISATVNNDFLNSPLNSYSPTLTFWGNWVGYPITTVVKAKLRSPITATTPAGVYSDTFRVNVTY